jgi:molybdenum cofactor synthesis domain-containing protein
MTLFKRLTPRSEALRLIEENLKPMERTEAILLEEACGRVLASDIVSEMDVPPFDRAAMDGYAVRAEDTYGASTHSPKRLRLIAVQGVGEVYKGEVKPGECIQVSTGSPIPKGCDAVVMREYVKRVNEVVDVYLPVYPGANISKRGEDIKRGETVAERETLLTPAKIGALAAIGVKRVEVFEKPKVAIIATGSEVRPPGVSLRPGEIYDVNSYTLSTIVSNQGCIPIRIGVVPDEWEALNRAIQDATKRYDMIVLSGGSSVGETDLIRGVVEELGVVVFHGLRIKPGKPTLFALIDGKPLFGMPGYPTSCLSNAYLFLIPALRIIAHLPPYRPRVVRGRLSRRVVAPTGREQVLTVRLIDGEVHPVFKESGAITSMSEADGYILIPVGVDVLEEGEEVEVHLFEDFT